MQDIQMNSNFTTLRLRKQLIGSLIYLKIDFNNYVYSPLANVQKNSLQRLQKVAASFEALHLADIVQETTL